MTDDISRIVQLIDSASDNRNIKKFEQGVVECESALASAQGTDRPLLYYFLANAYSGIRNHKAKDESYMWSWIQPERTREILALREARRDTFFGQLEKVRKCQILTNLGNALNGVGRNIEAIEEWDTAITILPRMAMAHGNRGKGILTYGETLYDKNHQDILYLCALRSLEYALSPKALWESNYPDSVRDQFQVLADQAKSYVNDHRIKESDFSFDNWSLGEISVEIEYRKWRLNNRLFLNPLNDIGTWPVAARDVFHLPNHTYKGTSPRYVEMFDLLKQEYVTACLLLFEGTQGKLEHYGDRGNTVYNRIDSSVGGVNLEKQKLALRSAYSILDKTGVFLNEYYDLGVNAKKIGFRSIWYEGKNRRINSKIPQKNWRLRGLYSLAQDIFDNELKLTALPYAELLNDVRNAAEHRFVRLFKSTKQFLPDEVMVKLRDEDLHMLALSTLKTARAALVYLSLSVHINERLEKNN